MSVLIYCTTPELRHCPAITPIQGCASDCACSSYGLSLKPSSCSPGQVFVEYKIQFTDKLVSCYDCVDCDCSMIGYQSSCGVGEKPVDIKYFQCPDCRTIKTCVKCGPDDLDPCRGSLDPCCGNTDPNCCILSTDPCCGSSSEQCNPCSGSGDQCCGSTDPCCGSSNPECDPCMVDPAQDQCNPCFDSTDECCDQGPCCASTDPCCGVDATCENGCADYCICHPEDPDCQPTDCNPPPACGPCQYETTGCACDDNGDPCCEDPESCGGES